MTQKVAYVTGGMGGIGTAICQRLHRDGFKVIAGCGPSRDHVKWIGEQKALGYTFYVSSGNVADWQSTVDAFTRARGGARPDRRAGEQRRHHARPHVPEDVARRLGRRHRHEPELDVQRHEAGRRRHGRARLGPHHPDLVGQRREGPGRQTNYSAAKAGMHGFTMALAQEIAAKGVTVNTVSPGYIGTEMVRAIKPEVLEKIVATIPVKRLGTPDEIGSIVGWLASDESGFTTGADFSCNGGLHMG
jgi:acetoacetyl-CoA reductase